MKLNPDSWCLRRSWGDFYFFCLTLTNHCSIIRRLSFKKLLMLHYVYGFQTQLNWKYLDIKCLECFIISIRYHLRWHPYVYVLHQTVLFSISKPSFIKILTVIISTIFVGQWRSKCVAMLQCTMILYYKGNSQMTNPNSKIKFDYLQLCNFCYP